MKKTVILLMSALAFTACGSDAETKEENKDNTSNKTEKTEVKTKSFSVVEGTQVIKWTGYKLAEKVPVTGEFKTFEFSGYKESGTSVADLMTGANVDIDFASTKTGDESRDLKIVNHFFGTMTETSTITATIDSMTGETEGTAKVTINMNSMSVTPSLSWKLDETNSFVLNGSINVPDWKAQPSLDSLNKVCEAKHKGEGDEAITWPDVSVSAYVQLDIK